MKGKDGTLGLTLFTTLDNWQGALSLYRESSRENPWLEPQGKLLEEASRGSFPSQLPATSAAPRQLPATSAHRQKLQEAASQSDMRALPRQSDIQAGPSTDHPGAQRPHQKRMICTYFHVPSLANYHTHTRLLTLRVPPTLSFLMLLCSWCLRSTYIYARFHHLT